MGISFFRHLYEAKLVLSIRWSDIAVLLILLLIPFPIRIITDWTPPLRRKWWQHTEIVAALIIMGTIGLLASVMLVVQQMAPQLLFTCPWWLTTATLGIASVLVALTIHHDPTRPTINDKYSSRPYSVRWVLLGTDGLIVGGIVSLFIMTDTIWRIAPVMITLIGGLMIWLWLLHFFAVYGERKTVEAR
ncbi:MAG: hypothetical protein GFH27_549301n203 [Chloroflexi bacterium AL-W]|nr:hypothetical protein [Chloroflexi bacterium AL-N1]NOK68396.1 hypothetical protein [Chloroflexi bacterium AL-N10]NOK74042.1 hypothetical protein [Chloroflexi bacterium AL-N5]NOK83010.1 hypothetical protein [Chloroflexi bacterium AL-W]NOK90532.1 hypothetical protein [Chloroflexi bacterium AL-N15]